MRLITILNFVALHAIEYARMALMHGKVSTMARATFQLIVSLTNEFSISLILPVDTVHDYNLHQDKHLSTPKKVSNDVNAQK
jgi:hypothetical protein